MNLSATDNDALLHAAWPSLTPLPSSTVASYKHRSQTKQNQQPKLGGPQHAASTQRGQIQRNEYPDYVTAFTTKVKTTAQSLQVASGNRTHGRSPSRSNTTLSTQLQRQGISVVLPASSYGRLRQNNITRWNAASSDYVPISISLSPEYMERMEQLIHDPKDLGPHGYVFDALSPEELARKGQRCKRCLKSIAGKKESKGQVVEDSKVKEKQPHGGSGASSVTHQLSTLNLRKVGEQARRSLALPVSNLDNVTGKERNGESEPKPVVCKFHPGMILRGFPRIWSCCNSNPGAPPCSGADTHLPLVFAPDEIKRNWKFYPTPQHTYQQPGILSGHCYAVAIDCEMGMSVSGESELIRVTVVDHITGVVLLDSLVWPDAPMQHYNTRFTGIVTKDMHEARRRGTCLMGREAAREAVWQFVGPQTIVCLHSGQNDFTTLRWIHHRIIDTFLLEPVPVIAKLEDMCSASSRDVGAANSEQVELGEHIEVPEHAGINDTTTNGQPPPDQLLRQKKKKGSGARSLQTLARVKLGRNIQIKEHDSIEDAVATRDLVHWAVINGPSSGLTKHEEEAAE